MISPRRGHGVARQPAQRALRRRHRRVDVRSRALREHPDDLGVPGGVARLEGAPAGRLATLAADEVAGVHRLLLADHRPTSSRDALLEDVEAAVEVVLADGQRGQEAHHVVVDAAGEHEQVVLHAAALHGGGDVGRGRGPRMNSMPIISPSPRTSPTSAKRSVQPRSRSRTRLPSAAARSGMRSARIVSITATAAAQATALPP